jgi:mitochondrial fission protein ELM1
MQVGSDGPPRIAVISDGKAGHRNQSLGLADALQRQIPELIVEELAPLPRLQALLRLLWPGQRRAGYSLLIGAGHGTHLSLLALGRVERCPTIVLMRPSFPGSWFDLRIEPRHDGGIETDSCWLSEGPLNRMQPAPADAVNKLMLVGGPSPHYHWDQDAVLAQIQAICERDGAWVLSSSRRTPAEFMTRLEALALSGLTVHRAEDLPPGWLGEQLPRTQYCWVTPDSASMVYEALSAGCAVGLFDLSAIAGSRVAAAIARLGERGWTHSFADVFAEASVGGPLEPPAQVFAEADRIAARIMERGWLRY